MAKTLRKIFDFPSQKCRLCRRICRQRRRISTKEQRGLEIWWSTIVSTQTACSGLCRFCFARLGKKTDCPWDLNPLRERPLRGRPGWGLIILKQQIFAIRSINFTFGGNLSIARVITSVLALIK